MENILAVPFLLSLILLFKKHKKAFLILVSLQILSLLAQPLAGISSSYDSNITLLNVLFVNLNLFLIIAPWSFSNFSFIKANSVNFILFFQKNLYRILFVNLTLNLLLLIIILVYIPDIASFKSQGGFYDLYEQIPYFSTIFRYAYVSQNLGYLAIPLLFYYVSQKNYKKSKMALIYASSSLVSGFAFYSRAQIFTFVVVLLAYFYLVKITLPLKSQLKISSRLKVGSLVIISLFLVITFVRFTAMDYYGDRIPEKSIIKDPVLYSLADYAGQGYSNGIDKLEVYSEFLNLGGEQLFRDIYQILNYVGIMDWDVESSKEKISKSYNYDGGAFNGYTAYLVYNIGYFLTFLISLTYFLIIKSKLYSRTTISLESLFVLVLLLIIPVVSIFYSGYALLYFPFLFIAINRFLFKFQK